MPFPRIIGTGFHVPENVVTNDDLAKTVDTTDQWVRERTGIRERRWVAPESGVGPSDLAEKAARMALGNAGVGAEEIELIVFCTMTPDRLLPSSACLLQAKIGAVNAAAFDVVAACSGFVYGLATVESFMKTGRYNTVLLVGAEVFSNRLNHEDRTTTVLFGDGAGACVLRNGAEPGGILSTHLFADGSQHQVLWVPSGGSVAPPTVERCGKKEMFVQMQGPDLFKIGVKRFCEAVDAALAHNGLSPEALDCFVPHQANARIIEMVQRKLGLPDAKVVVNIDRYGNTTAASIPIALHEAVTAGRIQAGSIVLLASFGGGLTWASALIRW
ncbi:MAG: ketoacyl-ACP synthase III [Planctomycetes bacterium]|nr:ketoacyl-ACP synthase III [Planctomycetota bacterium]